MTVLEAIEQLDALKPNEIPMSEKLKWLTELDGRVFYDLISAHVPDMNSPTAAPVYNDDSMEEELLIKHPHESVYRWWLSCMVDLTNLEFQKYDVTHTLFNNAFGEFSRKYHRSHLYRVDIKDYTY